ncbi:MAG: hypothetical protein ABSB42_02535 [Tepidisphaeraceae bacterium]
MESNGSNNGFDTYESTINARIIELPAQVKDGIEPTAHERGGGDYLPAKLRLKWLPCVGDLMRLNSRINASKGNEPIRHYEVVKIMHRIDDVFEDSPHPYERRGSHLVDVYVKLSSNPLFEDDQDG